MRAEGAVPSALSDAVICEESARVAQEWLKTCFIPVIIQCEGGDQ